MTTEHERRFGEFEAPMQQDPINPDYYREGGIETYDFIAAKRLCFALGNVVKYVVRYGRKDGVQALYKARWYLDRKIEEAERNGTD
jgi:hypothetical protein